MFIGNAPCLSLLFIDFIIIFFITFDLTLLFRVTQDFPVCEDGLHFVSGWDGNLFNHNGVLKAVLNPPRIPPLKITLTGRLRVSLPVSFLMI